MKSDNEWIASHRGLAVHCAHRFMGRGIASEELIAQAQEAMLLAKERFEESRGVSFATYAVPYMLSALRALCQNATPMRVPRREMRMLATAYAMRDKLRHKLLREPTMSELASALGIASETLSVMLSARQRMQHITSLQADTGQVVRDPDGSFEDFVLLKEVIASLPRPYAQVLWLRFARGYAQTEVAKRLGYSQSQLSRIEREGKRRLRIELSK